MDDPAISRASLTAVLQSWLVRARNQEMKEGFKLPAEAQAILNQIERLIGEGQSGRRALHNAPEGYLRTDPAGLIIEANPAAAHLVNSTPEDLAGNQLIYWVEPEDRAGFLERWEQLRNGMEFDQPGDAHNASSWETTLLTKAGKRREVEITAVPAPAHTNQEISWWIRDIRSERQAQKSINRQDVILQTLVDQTPIAILIASKNRIIYANPAAAQIFGYPQQELLERNLLSLVHPDYHSTLQAFFEVHPTGQETIRAEVRLQNQNASDCWSDINLGLFTLEGETFQLMTAYDITQSIQAEYSRKELLGRLVTVQEEERARLARELHDQMGQNLTALMLGLKSLETRLPVEASNRQKFRELFDLINDLGQEVHRVALDLRPTSLDDVGLDSTLANYIDDWAERNDIVVDYEVTSLPHYPIPTQVATTIYRIVQEALNNILKHARAKHVSIIVSHWPRQIRVIVEDDGCGFEVDKKMHPSPGGQSLGLLGMRERAELVGGKIHIESEEGKGTTVFVQLPLPGEAESDAQAAYFSG